MATFTRALREVVSQRSPLLELPARQLRTGELRYLQVACQLHAARERESGDLVTVLLADVSDTVRQRHEAEEAYARLQEEAQRHSEQLKQLAQANQRLLEANEELSSANAELRSGNEELLISNEEVQAATEERETLNEELQATNEELQTLNEELQATIEELNTTNDDLEARTVELQELASLLEAQRGASEQERARLEAILDGIPDAVLLVDRGGRVVLANEACRRLFGDDCADLAPEDEHGKQLPERDRPQQRAARGQRFNMQFSLRREDGSFQRFEAIGHPISADNGPQAGVVVVRDISERSLHRVQ